MKTYLDLVRHVLEQGSMRPNRTGTSTLSVFGHQARYDLREGFPLMTTKKMHFDSIVWELLWFLKGATNINDGLSPHTKIWDAWADHQGELGPIYGHQWRRWTAYDPTTNRPLSIDQLTNVINNIQTDPTSRRLMVSAWNVGDLDAWPCHLAMCCSNFMSIIQCWIASYISVQPI